jgi:hypothetical protein
MPHFDAPVCCWIPDAWLPSPADVKTLVIRRVEALSPRQQQHLSDWLAHTACAAIRVVSTTTQPLFPRVAAGVFLDELYYRLNTVMFNGADVGLVAAGADVQVAPVPGPRRAG